MKNIIVFAFLSTLISCKITPNTPEIEAEERLRDSMKNVITKNVDSLVTSDLLDTTGVSNAPVKIIHASVIQRDVYLEWKNVSNKPISAIRFKWYGLNAFGEPAEMGSNYIIGFGGGFSDDEIRPGKKDSGTWTILSRDAKKIVLAWPIEVAFNDGTKWTLKN